MGTLTLRTLLLHVISEPTSVTLSWAPLGWGPVIRVTSQGPILGWCGLTSPPLFIPRDKLGAKFYSRFFALPFGACTPYIVLLARTSLLFRQLLPPMLGFSSTRAGSVHFLSAARTARLLRDQICQLGTGRCPRHLFFPTHSPVCAPIPQDVTIYQPS